MTMIAGLRQEADREAQKALRSLVAFYATHPGERNALLEDTYRAAERVIDAIDEYESHLVALEDAEESDGPCCGADGSTPHWLYCENHPTAAQTMAGTTWAPGIEQYQAESR